MFREEAWGKGGGACSKEKVIRGEWLQILYVIGQASKRPIVQDVFDLAEECVQSFVSQLYWLLTHQTSEHLANGADFSLIYASEVRCCRGVELPLDAFLKKLRSGILVPIPERGCELFVGGNEIGPVI